MRPSVPFIATALAALSCPSATPTHAEEPTPDEAQTPMTAVSRRESYVFASTPAGLFRVPLATKRWERLKTPPEMPLDGTFADQPGRSPLVLYVAMRSSIRPIHAPAPRPDLRHGLYLSRDDGLSWELISGARISGPPCSCPAGTSSP